MILFLICMVDYCSEAGYVLSRREFKRRAARIALAGLGLSYFSALFAGTPHPDTRYREQTEAWRKAREESLLADGGWLTVTGLFWLDEGLHSAGSARDNKILLPDSAPSRLGTLDVRDGRVVFRSATDGVTKGGKLVHTTELGPYSNESDDFLEYGPIQLLLIRRGDRWGLRLKDRNSNLRREFSGLRWYPLQKKWCLKAHFTPSSEGAQITFDTIIGDQTTLESAGFAEFQLDGKRLKLQAAKQEDKLFFVFRDQTSGEETYAASRFLYSDAPKDGEVILDFNRAVNPPCAFTPFATCPLPPSQNRLGIRIEAGEQKYEGPKTQGVLVK